ncbi:Presequence protease, partial [Durusdinium trenchii]
AHGFEVKAVKAIPEFDVTAYHLEHVETAARYVHIDTDDVNNAFGVTFRTPAQDSTGLPHILEHTVLCGSERFPVRDPFFKMIKRSLNTFMNALTASDHTMYPFATRNAQDFDNLLQVYLDATLFPKLDNLDFLQEGHRLERDPEDPALVTRTGVVYNEMKGTLGSSSTLFYHRLNEHLLENTTYANISGGDPPAIAHLTHDDLVEFHRVHYHPSNALFYSYGDLPLENHLRTIQEHALSRFQFSQTSADVQKVLASSAVSKQKSALNSTIRVKGPAEPLVPVDKQAKFCLARVLEEPENDADAEYESMLARVVSTLLLEGSSAPLYASLIDSQLAPDFGPGTGYDSSTMHATAGVGVQGIRADDATLGEIRSALETALVQVAQTGFDQRRVDAVLHQVELSMKQKPTTFGLTLLYLLSSAFTHAPLGEGAMLEKMNETITLDDKIKRMVAEMKDSPDFWPQLVRKLFLEPAQPGSDAEWRLRSDFVSLVMEADENFSKDLATAEKEQLVELSRSLSEQDLARIDQTTHDLESFQDEKQDVSCLPTLSINDIPRVPEDTVEVNSGLRSGNNLCWVENQSTNGVVYLRAFFDTSHIPDQLKPLLPLFTSMLGNVDTSSYSYQDLSVELDLASGGIGFGTAIMPWYGQEDLAPSNHRLLQAPEAALCGQPYREGVVVTTSSLSRNLDRTLALLHDITTGSDMARNMHHAESLMAQTVNAASAGLSSNALGYARKWAAASLGGEFAKREALSGLSQVELLFACSEDLPGTLPALQALLRAVFRPENMTVCVVAGGSEISQDSVLSSVDQFSAGLGRDSSGPVALEIPESCASANVLATVSSRKPCDATYIGLPLSVHNCAVSLPTKVSYGHSDDAAMMVLAQLASSNFLHQNIREKGGAYGGGAGHDLIGTFNLYSYYDPNSYETLRVFSRSMEWLCKGSFSERDIDEALLSVFGSIDAPQEVRTKGGGTFMYGTSPEQRQAMRDRFFSLDKAALVRAANEHLGPHIEAGHEGFVRAPFKGCVAIGGSQDTPVQEGWGHKQFS